MIKNTGDFNKQRIEELNKELKEWKAKRLEVWKLQKAIKEVK